MAEPASTLTSRLSSNQPTRFLISDLCALLEAYLEPEQIREVNRAYLFSAEAHEGQMRLTGEPYIHHPLAVAKTLAEMHIDHQSIIAAILHDVIEDTPTAKEQLATEFSDEIAELVDGVSKLTHLKFESKIEAQAENFRKMILAMVKDLRVIMVKLADRLHNMRTLDVMPQEKRTRIARETLEIYAPIAHRLGMNGIRRELEQLGFKTLYPLRYATLDSAMKKARGNRKEVLQKIEAMVCSRLEEAGIEARIFGREKNLYSIYKKMKQKRLPFAEVFDVFANRIIVDAVDTCYRALGVIHTLFKPVPGKFKDYIAIPKANGYQSLHTIVVGPHGTHMEVQIRTQEMDLVGESGIAAHWLYKSDSDVRSTAQVRAREWLKSLLEIQQSAGNSIEFLESVKVDLFPDEVYVFTPLGEIKALPRGATPVDFAYAVHSDIGNSCVAAKIDRRLAPLSTVLESGQTVEVITAPTAKPNPAWLSFVATAKARTNIRSYLKKLQMEEAVNLGRRLLNKSLGEYLVVLDDMAAARINAVLEEFGLQSLDELLADVGLGNRLPQLVAKQLVGDSELSEASEELQVSASPLAIRGTEGLVLNYGNCCHPIPGDLIIGVMSAGRGLVVHRQSCRNVREFRRKPDKCVDLRWAEESSREFLAAVRAETLNQRGVLAMLAAKIAGMDSNIENISFEERDGATATINFVLSVSHRDHLARIMRRMRSIPEVMKVSRIRG